MRLSAAHSHCPAPTFESALAPPGRPPGRLRRGHRRRRTARAGPHPATRALSPVPPACQSGPVPRRLPNRSRSLYPATPGPDQALLPPRPGQACPKPAPPPGESRRRWAGLPAAGSARATAMANCAHATRSVSASGNHRRAIAWPARGPHWSPAP